MNDVFTVVANNNSYNNIINTTISAGKINSSSAHDYEHNNSHDIGANYAYHYGITTVTTSVAPTTNYYIRDYTNFINATAASTATAAATAAAAAAVDDEEDNSGKMAALCEIGSVPFPDGAEWLIGAVAGFQQMYGELHPYLAAALCIIGTIMNLITVVVLTRKSMISPVNVLLCAVAVCDIVVMSSYLIFVWHFLFVAASRCQPDDYSYAWAIFTMFHAHASVIFHATSIWLTVSLAQIRVLTIRRATVGPAPNISERFTAVLAVATYLIMSLVNLPNFLTFEIMEVPSTIFLPCLKPTISFNSVPPTNSTTNDLTTSTISPLSTSSSLSQATTMSSINRTVPSLFVDTLSSATGTVRAETVADSNVKSTRLPLFPTFTIVPTASSISEPQNNTPTLTSLHDVTLSAEKLNESDDLFIETTVFSVRAQENDCMKLKLAFWSNGMVFKVVPCLLLTVSIVALLNIIADVAHKRKNLAQVMKKKVPKDHTTPMLAAVLSIFLIAELPQGVMLVLTGIFSSEIFHKKIYLPLGDFMDLLSLLNSAIGFLIYVGMSRKFRSVFFQLLFSCIRCVLNSPARRRSIDDEWRDGGGDGDGWQYESHQQRDNGEHAQQQQQQRRGRTSTISLAWKKTPNVAAQIGAPSQNALFCKPTRRRQQKQQRRSNDNTGQLPSATVLQQHDNGNISKKTNVAQQCNENGGGGQRRRRMHERATRLLFFGRRRYYEYYKARNERDAARRRRRFTAASTTTDYTKTEQLSSYYPCSASTLNACAAATVAAAASLGSHLLIYDPFSHLLESDATVDADVKNYLKPSTSGLRLPPPPSRKGSRRPSSKSGIDEELHSIYCNENVTRNRKFSVLLHVPSIPTNADPPSTYMLVRTNSRSESPTKRKFSKNAEINNELSETPISKKTSEVCSVKRISFNLADTISQISDSEIFPIQSSSKLLSHTPHELMSQRPVKTSSYDIERSSSIKIVPPKAIGIKKHRRWPLTHYFCSSTQSEMANESEQKANEFSEEAIKIASPDDEAMTDNERKNELRSGFIQRFQNWFLSNWRNETTPYPLHAESTSPQRRLNILRAESQFIGSIY